MNGEENIKDSRKANYQTTEELEIYREYVPQRVDTSLIKPDPGFEIRSKSTFSSSFKHMGTADGDSVLPDWLI